MPDQQIITRGNLPHWYVPGAAHFVTFRLAGTIPVTELNSMRIKKELLLAKPLLAGKTERERKIEVHKLLFVDYDNYLDENRTIDWLHRPTIAALLRRALYHHNCSKYHLMSYCVMPNHVHVLFQPIGTNVPSRDLESNPACEEESDARSPLASIMHSLKSYTANEANKLLGRSGQFWQHESYDHWVRDNEELERIVAYIDANPVKAGLVGNGFDWYFSSAHDRYLQDGTKTGLLT